MSPTKPKRQVGRLVVTVLFVAAALWLFTNRQYAADQITVWQYQPSSDIRSLASRANFSERGNFLYYASQPALEGTQRFNSVCGKAETGASILGCYAQNRIYIYNVSDATLDGIREVTAAHEMLHAAYVRLSDSQRQAVDRLLETEYQTLKNDPDFAERITFYDSTEPGQRDNELHSIIGTEVGTVSRELEQYYKQYFVKRQVVTNFHTSYASVFTRLEVQAADLNRQITQLTSTIETDSKAYNQAVTKLNADIQTFNTRATNQGFTTESQFINERQQLLGRVTELTSTRESINGSIETYNSLRTQLESIAVQSSALNRSIDSRLAPAPSL